MPSNHHEFHEYECVCVRVAKSNTTFSLSMKYFYNRYLKNFYLCFISCFNTLHQNKSINFHTLKFKKSFFLNYDTSCKPMLPYQEVKKLYACRVDIIKYIICHHPREPIIGDELSVYNHSDMNKPPPTFLVTGHNIDNKSFIICFIFTITMSYSVMSQAETLQYSNYRITYFSRKFEFDCFVGVKKLLKIEFRKLNQYKDVSGLRNASFLYCIWYEKYL